MPIGTFPETEYYNAVCQVPPASKIYIFSDGVYEIEQPDGKMWSLNSFIDLLTKSNQEFMDLDQILTAIQTTTHSPAFTDDCSLLELILP